MSRPARSRCWVSPRAQRAAVAAAGADDRRERRAGLRLDIWFGVAAPAKTPPDVVARLAKEIAEIVANARRAGAHRRSSACALAYLDGDAFRALIRADHERFGKIIRDAGIAPN